VLKDKYFLEYTSFIFHVYFLRNIKYASHHLTQAELLTNLAKEMAMAFAGDLAEMPPCLGSE